MTMRLRSSRAPTRNGVNSALILSSPYSTCSAAREKSSHGVSKEHTRTTRGPGQAGVLIPLLINWSMGEISAREQPTVTNWHLIGVTHGVLSGSNRSPADQLVDAAEKSHCLSQPYHPGSRGPRARNWYRLWAQPAVLFAQRNARNRPRTLAEAPGHDTPSWACRVWARRIYRGLGRGDSAQGSECRHSRNDLDPVQYSRCLTSAPRHAPGAPTRRASLVCRAWSCA